MISIKVDTSGLKSVGAMLSGMEKQVRFATAKALTLTAKNVEKSVYDEMRSKFDRPTPTTMRSLRTKPATKQDLTAMVYLKDRELGGNNALAMAQIIGHQFSGGARQRKSLEKAFSTKGLISASEYLAPGAGAKLDAYGNMSRGLIAQIMSQLHVGLDPASWSSGSKRSRRNVMKAGTLFWSFGKGGSTTVGIRGGEMVKSTSLQNHLPRGVWARVGGGVTPILIVINKPRYKQRIDMERIARNVITRDFNGIFNSTFEEAMRTAR